MVNKIFQAVSIAIAVVAVCTLLGIAVYRQHVPRPDPGVLVRADRKLVWPIDELPVELVPHPDVDPGPIGDALERWAKWLPEVQFVLGNFREYSSLELKLPERRPGYVLVSTDMFRDDAEGGNTTLHWDGRGRIFAADMVLSHRYVEDNRWASWVVTHEVGHVLGLSDDPPPCLDSNSVMCLQMLPRSRPTDSDLAALRKAWRLNRESEPRQ